MQDIPTWVPVVAIALSDGKGRWLMHRRPEGKHHAGLWEFPGGKVESYENPVLALIREVQEELGIALRGEDLDALAFADDALLDHGQGIVILLYSASKWQGEPQALEGGAVAWFTLPELEALPKPPLDRVLARSLAENAVQ
jgi:8-oxo-dGTP diphosphatase